MKFFLILCCGLIHVFSWSQKLSSDQLYKKIENYYSQNPPLVEYVEHIHKNALGYDTSKNSFVYVPLNGKKKFVLANLSEEFILRGGWAYFDNELYFMQSDATVKTREKEKALHDSHWIGLDFLPSYNYENLEKFFGSIKSFGKKDGDHFVITSKYLLVVDTFNYKIKSIQQFDLFEDKPEFHKYNFIQLPDSTQKFLFEQSMNLAQAARDYPTKTYKELKKQENNVKITSYEGKNFVFNNLKPFNTTFSDSTIDGKYIIFDFFYLSCYPCHQMTKWILDWMPSMDTSKMILIGIDATDDQKSMERFVKDKGVIYPIIIGQQARDILDYYKPDGYPTLFLLNPGGKIEVVHVGMSKQFLTKAEKIVKRQSL